MTRATSEAKVLLWGGRSQSRILQEMLNELALGKVSLIFDETLETPLFSSSGFF